MVQGLVLAAVQSAMPESVIPAAYRSAENMMFSVPKLGV